MNEPIFKRICGLLLKPDEERLINYLNPGLSINSKIQEDELINLFQDELHDLIYSFLNGGFSKKGFLFYPIIKDISTENLKRCSKIISIFEVISEHYEGIYKELSLIKKNFTERKIADFISNSYYLFENLVKDKKSQEKKIKIESFDFNDDDEGFLKPVFDLKKFIDSNLKEDVLDFHAHGSVGTRDYVNGFSDFDTLMILKKEAINPKNLNRMRGLLYQSRKFLYDIDPLQHHGHMIITEYDMDYYCESYYPLNLFSYSKSMMDNVAGDLRFNVRSSKNERLRRFFWFVHYFREIQNRKKEMGAYDVKFMFHAMTLFPALYLQAKGEYYYKRESFDAAKSDFSDKLWEPMKEVTRIRNKWKSPKVIPFSSFFSFNPLIFYQINSKVWDFTGQIKKNNHFDAESLSKSMFKLSEYAWENIKKDLE